MKAIRSIGLVLLGVALGAILTGSITASPPQINSQERLTFMAPRPQTRGSNLTFIYDNKSGACWLGIESSGGVTALASAPKESCQQ
jgi:hypothetical protein